MSYLDDRLLKIIEMKRERTNDKLIAQQFNMCPISLRHYENFVKNVLRTSENFEEVAKKSYVSESVMLSAAKFYGIVVGE